MDAPRRFEVIDNGAEGVRVVRFLDRRLSDDPVVREVADEVISRVIEGGKTRVLILDFSGVEQMSSSMVGKLIILQRRMTAQGGKLRLCGMNPALRTVLRTTNLDRVFAIDADRSESLAAV